MKGHPLLPGCGALSKHSIWYQESRHFSRPPLFPLGASSSPLLHEAHPPLAPTFLLNSLLDFPPNTMHEMCCNMPYLVAIATIATNLCRKKTQLNVSLHQPVATHVFFMLHQFFYYNTMRHCNQHLQARSCWLQIIILRRICCYHRCNCIVPNAL